MKITSRIPTGLLPLCKVESGAAVVYRDAMWIVGNDKLEGKRTLVQLASGDVIACNFDILVHPVSAAVTFE